MLRANSEIAFIKADIFRFSTALDPLRILVQWLSTKPSSPAILLGKPASVYKQGRCVRLCQWRRVISRRATDGGAPAP